MSAADLLIATWHRVYGDGRGWTAFKAAIDEQRFDDALQMLAPGIIAEAQRNRRPGNVWQPVIPT